MQMITCTEINQAVWILDAQLSTSFQHHHPFMLNLVHPEPLWTTRLVGGDQNKPPSVAAMQHAFKLLTSFR
jgi:hypothetical protein